MARSGQDYLNSLRDGRSVFHDGALVASIPDHKSFSNAAASIAKLYDFQSRPENAAKMTFLTEGGSRVSRTWQLPTSYDELVERREALVAWAELHQGFMGRSPDHVGSTISAMYIGADLYDTQKGGRSGSVRDYYHYASERDLYLSYVIIDPQGDRSKGTSEGSNATLAVSIVDEDSEGITVRGSKMLGTGAAFSNEVLVTTLRPLKPGEEAFAFTAVVPINAKGMKLMSRRSYEGAAPSRFDYPLSSQFDENDFLIFFDDVKITWDRVFVHRDTTMQLAQWHQAPVHSYQNYQATIRLLVKLRFLVGLARKITEAIGTINYPAVAETLGEMAAQVGMIEAFVAGMEAKGFFYGKYFMPDKGLLYAAQVQSQALYPENHALAPGSIRGRHADASIVRRGFRESRNRFVDRRDPEIAGAVGGRTRQALQACLGCRRFGIRLAAYPVRDVLFRPRMVTTGMAYRTFDWNRATSQVDSVLAAYETPTAVGASTIIAAE